MDKQTQDKIIHYILIIPMVLTSYYIHDSIGIFELVSSSSIFIALLYIAVTGYVFARIGVFLIRIIPICIQLPFAYYYEKYSNQKVGQD